ncbi:MAG: hypothetical protein KKG68_02270, partial [Verrucomicrobia bacterium]|nr:hypothetical protein [Verrucomicrobiota bacterium]
MDNTVNHKQRSAVGRRPAGAHCLVTLALILSFIFFSISVASAATKTWITTTGAADWFVGTNWSPSGVPGPTDDVVITNINTYNVLLTGSVTIANFTLGGGGAGTRSLVFSNWNTTLTATNVTILTNGNMTCPGPFTNNVMSNRVSIVCSNKLQIDPGGSINVDFKGYDGAVSCAGGSRGYGPGGGATSGGGEGNGGGGYGGKGGGNYTRGGPPYGSATGPALPGSGGGIFTYSGKGGAGGGAVQVEVGDTIIVNGTISASGENCTVANAGGGSGGGIYISCNMFAGTNGIIRANGGTQSSSGGGAGGGGRVTVLYNTSAQSNQPVPTVSFSAAAGAANLVMIIYNYIGDIGTLYFSDPTFLYGWTNMVSYPHFGELLAPGFTNWSIDNLVFSNNWIRIPGSGFRLTVTNNLRIIGNNYGVHKLELTNAIMTVGRDFTINNASLIVYPATNTGITFDFTNNLSLSNGVLTLYGGNNNNSATFTYSSNLTIYGGTMTLYGGTNNQGALLACSTNLTIYGGTVTLYGSSNNGASLISSGNIALTNSTFNLYSGLTSAPTVNCRDVYLNNSTMGLYNNTNYSLTLFNCDGNLTLTNSARLNIGSGMTNESTPTFGALLDVTSDIFITSTNCWICPYSHTTNGGSPLFRMRNLIIAATNAGFNADGKGFAGGVGTSVRGYGPGGSPGQGGGGAAWGAGHGGIGGGVSGGNIYGSSNAPVIPGSGSGGTPYGTGAGGAGGSLVRIQARNTIMLNGTITANGVDGTGGNAGGGSGGAIYITARTLAGTNSCLYANGANGGDGGGGGGGRIAIWRAHDTIGGIIQTNVAGGTGTGGSGGVGSVVWGGLPDLAVNTNQLTASIMQGGCTNLNFTLWNSGLDTNNLFYYAITNLTQSGTSTWLSVSTTNGILTNIVTQSIIFSNDA